MFDNLFIPLIVFVLHGTLVGILMGSLSIRMAKRSFSDAYKTFATQDIQELMRTVHDKSTASMKAHSELCAKMIMDCPARPLTSSDAKLVLDEIDQCGDVEAQTHSVARALRLLVHCLENSTKEVRDDD